MRRYEAGPGQRQHAEDPWTKPTSQHLTSLVVRAGPTRSRRPTGLRLPGQTRMTDGRAEFWNGSAETKPTAESGRVKASVGPTVQSGNCRFVLRVTGYGEPAPPRFATEP